jgi:hypothetical protein
MQKLHVIAILCAFFAAGCGSKKASMSQFTSVQNGMTLEEVQSVMGSSGELTTETSVAGYTGEIRTWANSDGSNMIVQFQNGRAIGKSQFGLQ